MQDCRFSFFPLQNLSTKFSITFQGEFNFSEAFSGEKTPGSSRLEAGEKLLAKLTSSSNFKETDMFTILRDQDSEICRPCSSAFPTQGSQVCNSTILLKKYVWYETGELLGVNA